MAGVTGKVWRGETGGDPQELRHRRIRKVAPRSCQVTLGGGKPPFLGSRKPCQHAKTITSPQEFSFPLGVWILGK